MYSLYQIAIAPFGRVRFRDFFFGDVITSIVKPLEDMVYVIYYVVTDEYKNKFFPNPSNKYVYFGIFFVQFAPFWWRFCQCLNRKYYTGLTAHLINAGKYFSKLIPPFVLIYTTFSAKKVEDINWGLYCFWQTIATLYVTVWDFYMDWGLFRSAEPGKWGLRS